MHHRPWEPADRLVVRAGSPVRLVRDDGEPDPFDCALMAGDPDVTAAFAERVRLALAVTEGMTDAQLADMLWDGLTLKELRRVVLAGVREESA